MLNRLYERNESVVDITQAEQVLMGLLEENTPVYQNLIIKELVYKSAGGYMVYDRFMGMWLLRN